MIRVRILIIFLNLLRLWLRLINCLSFNNDQINVSDNPYVNFIFNWWCSQSLLILKLNIKLLCYHTFHMMSVYYTCYCQFIIHYRTLILFTFTIHKNSLLLIIVVIHYSFCYSYFFRNWWKHYSPFIDISKTLFE